MFKLYGYRVALACSVLVNAILGGRLYEPLSARVVRTKNRKAMKAIDMLLGKGHCLNARIEYMLASKWRKI